MSALPAPIRLVAVVGPTAVGKTALAVNLAQRFNGEIVNADSRQVYVGMDVGTAKPTPAEQAAARHHLIDVRPPDEPFSVGEFLPLAQAAIADIAARGRLPILCGGTGQYVWALLEGWNVPAILPDAAFRNAAERRAQTEGSLALWHELNAIDPVRANAIGPQNVRRIIRALEIHRQSDAGPVPTPRKSDAPPYDALLIGLTADRPRLYCRIDRRVDRMMADGFLDEARRLSNQGYVLGAGPLSGVGYTQLGQHLAGELSLDDAVARTKTQTHRLVRRQYNWFKPADARIRWLDAADAEPIAPAIALIRQFLESRLPCDTIAPDSGGG